MPAATARSPSVRCVRCVRCAATAMGDAFRHERRCLRRRTGHQRRERPKAGVRQRQDPLRRLLPQAYDIVMIAPSLLAATPADHERGRGHCAGLAEVDGDQRIGSRSRRRGGWCTRLDARRSAGRRRSAPRGVAARARRAAARPPRRDRRGAWWHGAPVGRSPIQRAGGKSQARTPLWAWASRLERLVVVPNALRCRHRDSSPAARQHRAPYAYFDCSCTRLTTPIGERGSSPASGGGRQPDRPNAGRAPCGRSC